MFSLPTRKWQSSSSSSRARTSSTSYCKTYCLWYLKRENSLHLTKRTRQWANIPKCQLSVSTDWSSRRKWVLRETTASPPSGFQIDLLKWALQTTTKHCNPASINLRLSTLQTATKRALPRCLRRSASQISWRWNRSFRDMKLSISLAADRIEDILSILNLYLAVTKTEFWLVPERPLCLDRAVKRRSQLVRKRGATFKSTTIHPTRLLNTTTRWRVAYLSKLVIQLTLTLWNSLRHPKVAQIEVVYTN